MGTLDGKVAVVTGAAGNLGRYHSRHLAQAGATVVMTDLQHEADDVVQGIDAQVDGGGTVLYRRLDVTDWEGAHELMDSIADEHGSVDVLVNNAADTGTDIALPFMDVTPDVWDRQMAVDLKGLFVCSHAALGVMQRQSSGSIINISSGQIGINLPFFVPYVTAKAGVIGFTRSLATEAAEFDVRVNAVIVGLFIERGPNMPDEMYDQLISFCLERQLMKRPGDANDLSPTLCFLASDDARWITGQAIAVDGGLIRAGG